MIDDLKNILPKLGQAIENIKNARTPEQWEKDQLYINNFIELKKEGRTVEMEALTKKYRKDNGC